MMEESLKLLQNGPSSHCRYEDRQLEILNGHFEKLNRREEAKDQWVKDYIDRTMPIKSHFWILLGSLSILASFAAVIHYIDKL